MPIDRASLEALRNLISDASLTLETTPDLSQNRTASCRESLAAALALSEDLLKQHRTSAAVVLGRKGGTTTARRLGTDHYRKMAAARKSHGGGRPRKQTE
jgi:hypothetical protein